MGGLNTKKGCGHWKKKFFLNNFVVVLTAFHEEHLVLLKLHVPLGWERREGGGLSKGAKDGAISRNLYEMEK